MSETAERKECPFVSTDVAMMISPDPCGWSPPVEPASRHRRVYDPSVGLPAG